MKTKLNFYIFVILLISLLFILCYLLKKKENYTNNTTHFKIIVPFYNLTYNELKRCLDSIENQNYNNYEVCIVDDESNKNTNELNKIQTECKKKPKFKYIKKSKNEGPLYSRITGMKGINSKNEDVIVLVDGDDTLYDNNVLSYLNNIYSNNDILITYGNYSERRGNKILKTPMKNCKDFDLKKLIKNKSFRNEHNFNPSHLKTFKYKLFKKIKKEDFKIDNKIISSSTDLAMMIPMLEMAGDKIMCINKLLYIYTVDHPNSMHNNGPKMLEQTNNNTKIRRKKKYDTVTF